MYDERSDSIKRRTGESKVDTHRKISHEVVFRGFEISVEVLNFLAKKLYRGLDLEEKFCFLTVVPQDRSILFDIILKK